MSTSTRRAREHAAHPLSNRERRTAMNYAFRPLPALLVPVTDGE
jgi:hypothetical protein